MREVFFERADAAKNSNGVMTIVLQVIKVPGGTPEPVELLSCREVGALALIEAINKALRQ